MIDTLDEIRLCYQRALTLSDITDVVTTTQRGRALVELLSGSDAVLLHLALLDLELRTRFAGSYLPPPSDDITLYFTLAEQAGLPHYLARAQHYQGLLDWTGSSFEAGAIRVRGAMDALIACGDIDGQYYAASSLGLFWSVTGQLERGVGLMRQSLALHEQLDPTQRELPVNYLNRARLLMLLALNLFDLDHFDEALQRLGESRAIYERSGHFFGCTTEYAQLYARVGFWSQAEYWAQQGMTHGREASDRAYPQTLYGFVLGQQGRIAEAIDQLEQSLATVTRIGLERWQCALASVYLADCLLTDGPYYDPARADKLNNEAFALGEASGAHYGSIYALVNKTRLALTAGDQAHAVRFAVDAADRVRARNTLTLVREEEVLYWEYRALDAAGLDGCPSLADAHRRLEVAAGRIESAEMRQSFLENVPLHKRIRETYLASIC